MDSRRNLRGCLAILRQQVPAVAERIQHDDFRNGAHLGPQVAAMKVLVVKVVKALLLLPTAVFPPYACWILSTVAGTKNDETLM